MALVVTLRCIFPIPHTTTTMRSRNREHFEIVYRAIHDGVRTTFHAMITQIKFVRNEVSLEAYDAGILTSTVVHHRMKYTLDSEPLLVFALVKKQQCGIHVYRQSMTHWQQEGIAQSDVDQYPPAPGAAVPSLFNRSKISRYLERQSE